jgi:putative lipoprotein
MNPRPLLALLIPLCAFAGEERIAYTCDNGNRGESHIEISFSEDTTGRPQATLHFADEAVILPQVPAASGALYRLGDIRLHTQGDDAIVEDGKSNMRRCTRGQVAPVPPPAARQSATSSFIDLSGNVSYLARIALPPGAILIIRIQSGKRTLVEQRYELNDAQTPLPFSATVDRDIMGKKANATASARIEVGGKPFLVSEKPAPAIKNGRPVPIEIVLKPAPRKPDSLQNPANSLPAKR